MLRTLLIYYGVPFRKRRLARLYAAFLGPGDTAFDVGAHVGNRVRAWRSLGVRSVALEPQPACLRLLRQFYGADPGVTIRPEAIGATEGTATLYICDQYPTLSTIAADWIHAVKETPAFAGIRWNRREDIAVTTLDALIAEHGIPAFTKIDVEGHEPEVLAGLSTALPALSFEFLPAHMTGALACIDRLEELGSYEYNYALVETARLKERRWISPDRMREILRAMPPTARSGDVYARLAHPVARRGPTPPAG
jgi:FkbM family methyltransferase